MAGSILSRIATGDKAAVQECIEAYGKLVWALARRLSPNRADAEDAVQEIFIDLWRSAARFDEGRSSEVAFVTMIARRRLIDRLRGARRSIQIAQIEDGAEVGDESRRHDREFETCAEAAIAARALGELRPEQRKVLQLAIYQGLSHGEIARATGVPLGTVKTHVRRGLLQIRERLGIKTAGAAREASG
ncbi:MAG: RNA polymerase sigma factor [Pyrinomonadaceae bacterium]|nr:RNA polymerase sigma factor [Pyrinomonadaceae bacterium]